MIRRCSKLQKQKQSPKNHRRSQRKQRPKNKYSLRRMRRHYWARIAKMLRQLQSQKRWNRKQKVSVSIEFSLETSADFAPKLRSVVENWSISPIFSLDDPSTAYREAVLTHLEKNRPFVYLQLVPESETILDQINQCIEQITEAKKHEASYNIGDHVIAQFSEDEGYYRGRLESYSADSKTYTVYFLDFGNIDESVPVDHLFSYSDELKDIDPQVRGYLLDSIDQDKWEKTVRPWIEREKLNEVVEFTVLDKNACLVHLKIDFEEAVSDQDENESPVPHVEPSSTFQAQICGIEKDSFYIHRLPDDESGIAQIKESLGTCREIVEHQERGPWMIRVWCLMNKKNSIGVKLSPSRRTSTRWSALIPERSYRTEPKSICTSYPLTRSSLKHHWHINADCMGWTMLVNRRRSKKPFDRSNRPNPWRSRWRMRSMLRVGLWSFSRDKSDVVNDEHQSDGEDNDEDEIKVGELVKHAWCRILSAWTLISFYHEERFPQLRCISLFSNSQIRTRKMNTRHPTPPSPMMRSPTHGATIQSHHRLTPRSR